MKHTIRTGRTRRSPHLPLLAALSLAWIPAIVSADGQAERFRAEPGSWEQILRDEQPMPMPRPETRRTPQGVPPDFTRAAEKDLDSGEETVVPVDAVRALLDPVGSVDGHPGEYAEPQDGSDDAWLAENAVAGGITPTRPQPTTDVLGFPRRATYKLRMRSDDKYANCSASPFGSYHLITAAHCVFNHESDFPLGWVDAVWAFPAQTDLTTPLNEPDHPFGEARVTVMRTWTCWSEDANLDCDIALLTLDRRLPDRTGWLGREWGVEAASLNFNGYPTQLPYVPVGEMRQYPGFDAGNARRYFERYIEMDAFTYGGHSGGPVWRYVPLGNRRYLHGVNSTSDRRGWAGAARYRSNEEVYFNDSVAIDHARHPPVNRPDLKEETYHHAAAHKLLRTTVVGREGLVNFRYNVFNAGFAPSGTITVRFYLSRDLNITTDEDYLIGTTTLASLAANTYAFRDHQLRLTGSVPAGTYYLGWTMASANPEYGGMNYCRGAARPGCNNYAVIAAPLLVTASGNQSWIVTASSGAGGSISPAGTVTVADGARHTFTVTPAAGVQLGRVTGSCGGSMISATQFQTAPITSDCTVRASFSGDLIFASGFQ